MIYNAIKYHFANHKFIWYLDKNSYLGCENYLETDSVMLMILVHENAHKSKAKREYSTIGKDISIFLCICALIVLLHYIKSVKAMYFILNVNIV